MEIFSTNKLATTQSTLILILLNRVLKIHTCVQMIFSDTTHFCAECPLTTFINLS
jgi:hypothetical protein